MIEIRKLTFGYPRSDSASAAFAMRVEAFDVAQGASTALVGPSGSGKTTLLSLIAGTLRPDSGAISVNGKSIAELGDAALGRFRVGNIGQVFQSFELLEYLTVLQNVMLPWYISGNGTKSAVQRRASELLASVGIESKSRTRPSELSQGEQQRVAVCRAMFNNPPLLLADEPTGNLDRANKQNVVDLLVEQAKRENSTLLMVTHDESLLGKFDAVIDTQTVVTPMAKESSQ